MPSPVIRRSATSPGRLSRSFTPNETVLRKALLPFGWLSVACLLVLPVVAEAATYYVRVDGGSPARCTGLVNAPDPGGGSNQPCAWDHPFRAMPPGGTPRIAGGDTLIIGAGSYMMGFGAPGADNCDAVGAWDCYMPPVRSGPDSTHPTRIVGAGWDTGCTNPPELWGTERANQVLNLSHSNNVELACLAVTDHSGCVEFHSGALACERNIPPYGSWAVRGLYAEDSTSVHLRDLDIHGLGTGIHAGRLKDWTLERVRIAGNGWSGWDGDIGADSSNSGTMVFNHVTIEWTGCGAPSPGQQPAGCWAQTAGGYGDGLGTGATSGNWLFEDCRFLHNTSDGLDLLYGRLGSSIIVRRTIAEGNAGNQIKTNGPATIENSIVVGNCAFFEGQAFTHHVDNCRAVGNSLSLTLRGGDTATLANNTVTGEGDCLMIADCDTALSTCVGTESVRVRNNIFVGHTEFLSPTDRTCLMYQETFPHGNYVFDADYSLVTGVKDDACPGTHDICGGSAGLVSTSLAGFDAHLLASSPAIDAGTTAGAPAVDFDGLPRDVRPDLGAYEHWQDAAPTAMSVAIIGTPTVGHTLTGSYVYEDAEGDAEGASTYRWLRDGTMLSGATTTAYTVVAADLGRALTFEVTPVAQSGASPGAPVTSGAVVIVGEAPTVAVTTPTSAPTATATVPFLMIGGTAASGDPSGGDGSYAAAVTRVTWTSDRGRSGTATGTQTWQAEVPLFAGVNAITVTATDAGGATATDRLTVTVPSFISYMAEGATGPFFDLELGLANPNSVAAPVAIQYLEEDGSTVNQLLTLAANSHQTILVDGLAGLDNTAVSTVVTSTNALPLAVERTMTWDTTGYGSHTEKATPGAALTWYFAEGSEQAFFDTYLLLANPQGTANRATVQFLVEGGSPLTKVYDLLPTSRMNVWAETVTDATGGQVLLEKAFGIVVTFDQPGVAERAMYFGTSPFWNGGHESAGVNAPSTSWFHAEGATGPFFDTFILLSNPNSTPATVTLRFLLDSGATVTKTKTVGANARLTVGVEGEDPLLANAAMATEVTSDIPIVSERAMYWAGYPDWYEAHNAFGVTSTGLKWALGEGRVGGTRGYETYILLANPGTTAATVTVTYLREGGLPTIVRTYPVPATSRYNVYANTVPGLGSGERFGALIESIVPIAVERAMYSNSSSQPGVVWAAGTNATGTPIP